MSHYAQRFDDPACQWWADQAGDVDELYSPIIPLILEKQVTGELPDDYPNAVLFRDIGWAALIAMFFIYVRDFL